MRGCESLDTCLLVGFAKNFLFRSCERPQGERSVFFFVHCLSRIICVLLGFSVNCTRSDSLFFLGHEFRWRILGHEFRWRRREEQIPHMARGRGKGRSRDNLWVVHLSNGYVCVMYCLISNDVSLDYAILDLYYLK